MRPAYRYSLVVAALLILAALAVGSMSRSEQRAPGARPAATRLTQPPRFAPVRAPQDPERLPQTLEALQQDEAEALGPERAAARRRQRERMILERGGALPDAPAPNDPAVPAPGDPAVPAEPAAR